MEQSESRREKILHPDLDFFANGHNTMSVEEVSAG